jgi:hypothetical protein
LSNFSGTIDAPILSVIAKEVFALLKSDARLRELQANNAPRASYGQAGTATSAAETVINEARSGNGETFAQLMITFDSTSGAGRYRLDGTPATAAVGLEIPAGGGTIIITGMDNIKGFSMIAQGATTMPFFRYLFK